MTKQKIYVGSSESVNPQNGKFRVLGEFGWQNRFITLTDGELSIWMSEEGFNNRTDGRAHV